MREGDECVCLVFPGCTSPSSFRCVVDVVVCTGNGSECWAAGCFHTPVAQYSLALLHLKTLCCLCLFSKLLYAFLMVPPRCYFYNQYYITNSIGVFYVSFRNCINLRLCQIRSVLCYRLAVLVLCVL